jgi:hypothetical protein
MSERILSAPIIREIQEIVRAELEQHAVVAQVEPLVDAEIAAEHIGVKENTLRSWASTKY